MAELEHFSVWEQVRTELGELLDQQTPVPEEVWKNAGRMLYQCLSEKNPHYAFLVQSMCDQFGFTPTKTMQKVFAQAGRWMMTGADRGTFEKIKRNGRAETRMVWVAHLLAVGNTLKSACHKTAMLSKLNWPDEKPTKASTIEKDYQKFRKHRPTERVISEMHKNPINADFHEKWKEISETTPDCLPELVGDTR